MSEPQYEDDTTPLEYFISGLVVLLFGLLYFFINHGTGFTTASNANAVAVSAPAVSEVDMGIAPKLLADKADNAGTAVAEDSVSKVEPAKEPAFAAPEAKEQAPMMQDTASADDEQRLLAEAEAAKRLQAEEAERKQAEAARLQAEEAERKQAETARLQAEEAERKQAETARLQAEEAERKQVEAQKLAEAEKLRQQQEAERLRAQEAARTLAAAEAQKAREVAAAEAEAARQQGQVFRLPDGTAVPVSNEGFEGAAKNAMARQEQDGEALMSEPMLFDDISFGSGSAELSADSQQQIRALAALLNTYKSRRILIRGHTDNTGGINTNSLLSIQRSDSMKKQLVELGIDKDRIRLEGVGELEPLVSNSTQAGRSKNRRIELILIE